MLSRMSSRVKAPKDSPSRIRPMIPGWPLPSPWSIANAARSMGESASPYIGCGRVGRGGARHVGVNAEQLRWCLDAHRLGDRRTPIAALRYKARVTEALHEHCPSAGGPDGIPPGGGGLAGETVAGQRRDHEMESV